VACGLFTFKPAVRELRLSRATAAALLIGSLLCIGSQQVAQAGGPGVGGTYVALGDSYAAGEGLGAFEPGTDVPPTNGTNTNPLKNTCHRSLRDAYGSIAPSAAIVLPSLPNSDRANWACSGATSTQMISAPDLLPISNSDYQNGQPAQISTVSGATKWISISAGGNDLEFSKLGAACAVYVVGSTIKRVDSSQPTCTSLAATEAAKLVALKTNLRKLYTNLLDSAPSAVLAVVGYPKIFPADYSQAPTFSKKNVAICVTNTVLGVASVGVPVTDAKLIDSSILQGLNSDASSVVDDLAAEPAYAGRIVFADPYHRSDVVPQNCTGDTPNVSVNGVVISPGGNGIDLHSLKRFLSSATFHPTKAGQAVMGRAVQTAFASTFLHYSGEGIQITGSVGAPVSADTSVSGGVPPMSAYPGIQGVPPQWAQLAFDGQTVTISGNPDAPGSWQFSVIVSDAHGDTVSIPVSIEVTGGGGGRDQTPSAFTYEPPSGLLESHLWPAADGWWLGVERSQDNQWTYKWVSPKGIVGATWTSDVYPFSVIAAPGGDMFLVGEHYPTDQGAVMRIGANGPVATRSFTESPYAFFEQQLAYGTDGHLYWWASLGDPLNYSLFQLDPTTLQTIHGIQFGEDNVGLTATPTGIAIINAFGTVRRVGYSDFNSANDGQPWQGPLDQPVFDAPYKQFSVGIDGAVADLADYSFDCASSATSERFANGQSWIGNVGALAAGDVPSCEVHDIDVLPNDSVVYTLRGSDGIYLMWVNPQGARTALRRIGTPGVIGLNASTVTDDSGLVVTAYTDVHTCVVPDPNAHWCSTVELVTYRDGILVSQTTLSSGEQLMVSPIFFVGRPSVALGHGQILVETYESADQPCNGDNCYPNPAAFEYRTFLSDVDLSRHPSFGWW
jgi:hypothetical protein